MQYDFSKQQIIDILSDDSQNNWLFSLADEIRKKYVGDEIHLRGLIEFSNICKKQCLYCGINSNNKNIERFRLSKEGIILQAKNASEIGYKTIVLQSGEDDYYSVDIICEIISEIKKFDVALTLSIGEKTYDELKAFKKAGADRYLIRIETSDENLYSKMHPNASFYNRLKCLEDLKKLNYEVGTGCLVGLPSQTIESLANDILFFKKINADMVGIGPFIAHKDTKLKNEKNGDFILSLKVMALTRILLKDINIPATTAMETIKKDGRILALQSGANVVMPNVGGFENQIKYEIYPNKIHSKNIKQYRIDLIDNIKKINRYVSNSYGNRKIINT